MGVGGGACQEGWRSATCFSHVPLVSTAMGPSTPMAYASAARRSITSVRASFPCYYCLLGPGWGPQAPGPGGFKELGEGRLPCSRLTAGLHAHILSSRTCLATLWHLLRPQNGLTSLDVAFRFRLHSKLRALANMISAFWSRIPRLREGVRRLKVTKHNAGP